MYKNPWYIEMTGVMQKIQEAAQKLEDEKWENKRKPAIDELTKNGTMKLIWDGSTKCVRGISTYFDTNDIDTKKFKFMFQTLLTTSWKNFLQSIWNQPIGKPQNR